MIILRLGLILLCGACWKPPFNPMPDVAPDFAPRSGAAMAGWVVEVHTLPLTCPDGEEATVTWIRPVDGVAAESTTVLFHSASFDYTYEVEGAQQQHRTPGALTRAWALRRVFTTIGHFVDAVQDDDLTGAMAQALVEQASQVILPGNCWGDLWHNDLPDSYVNDVETDGFERLGGAAAKWAFQMATETGFARESGLENGESLVTGTVYAVGFGEGGRAIGELLALGAAFDGAVLDSTPDDLDFYYANSEAFPEVIMGLDRLFMPGGRELNEASLSSVPRLPTRTSYLYSSLDEAVPHEIHAKAVSRLSNDSAHWVHDINARGHNTSGHDLGLAREAVAHMMNRPTYED